MGTVDVTEEEMEAYMLKKARPDDPLATPAALAAAARTGYDFV